MKCFITLKKIIFIKITYLGSVLLVKFKIILINYYIFINNLTIKISKNK
jgi:hypothetical protein